MPDAVSRQLRTADGTNIFRVFGPLPNGSFLQSLHFIVSTGTAGRVTIRAALGALRDLDAAAFAADERLIDFADSLTNEQPVIGINMTINSTVTFALPVNRRINNGPRWLHIALAHAGEGAVEMTVAAIFLTLAEVAAQFGTPRAVTLVPLPPPPTPEVAAPTPT